jgi:hypothetical protein
MVSKKLAAVIFLVGLIVGGGIGGVIGYHAYERYPPRLSEHDLHEISIFYFEGKNPGIENVTYQYPEHRNGRYLIIYTFKDGNRRALSVEYPGYVVSETMPP